MYTWDEKVHKNCEKRNNQQLDMCIATKMKTCSVRDSFERQIRWKSSEEKVWWHGNSIVSVQTNSSWRKTSKNLHEFPWETYFKWKKRTVTFEWKLQTKKNEICWEIYNGVANKFSPKRKHQSPAKMNLLFFVCLFATSCDSFVSFIADVENNLYFVFSS